MHRYLFIFAGWVFINQAAIAADGPIRPASASFVEPTKESSEYREFEIRVDNKPMGVHSLSIKSDGERHEVEMKSDVKVDLVVYAYVFKFRGKEVWRDGQVVFADIHTEDGGKKRDFFYKNDGKTLQVQFNGKPMPSEVAGKMTTSYWMLPAEQHRQKAFAIYDVDSGNIRTASINLVEEATISCSGRSIPCQHFRIEGPSPADLWIDADRRMVGQKSIEQGHNMELRLKKIENITAGK